MMYPVTGSMAGAGGSTGAGAGTGSGAGTTGGSGSTGSGAGITGGSDTTGGSGAGGDSTGGSEGLSGAGLSVAGDGVASTADTGPTATDDTIMAAAAAIPARRAKAPRLTLLPPVVCGQVLPHGIGIKCFR